MIDEYRPTLNWKWRILIWVKYSRKDKNQQKINQALTSSFQYFSTLISDKSIYQHKNLTGLLNWTSDKVANTSYHTEQLSFAKLQKTFMKSHHYNHSRRFSWEHTPQYQFSKNQHIEVIRENTFNVSRYLHNGHTLWINCYGIFYIF